MFRNPQIRRTTTLLLSGALFALSFGPAAPVASAQCADPHGNNYCTGTVVFNTPVPVPSKPGPCADPRGNNYCTGTVVFNTPVPVPQPAPQPQPQPQPIRPPQPQPQPQPVARLQITLDTDSAPVGGTLTVSGTGFALSGAGTDLFLNLVPAPAGGNLRTALASEMLRNDPSVIRSADDGSFSVKLAVPNAQPGLQQICALPQKNGLGNYICAPFTVLDGGTPGTTGLAPFRDPSAPIDPLAIGGR